MFEARFDRQNIMKLNLQRIYYCAELDEIILVFCGIPICCSFTFLTKPRRLKFIGYL